MSYYREIVNIVSELPTFNIVQVFNASKSSSRRLVNFKKFIINPSKFNSESVEAIDDSSFFNGLIKSQFESSETLKAFLDMAAKVSVYYMAPTKGKYGHVDVDNYLSSFYSRVRSDISEEWLNIKWNGNSRPRRNSKQASDPGFKVFSRFSAFISKTPSEQHFNMTLDLYKEYLKQKVTKSEFNSFSRKSKIDYINKIEKIMISLEGDWK